MTNQDETATGPETEIDLAKAPAAVAAKHIEDLALRYQEKKNEVSSIEAAAKEEKKVRDLLHGELVAAMGAVGMQQLTGPDGVGVNIEHSTVPTVEDWDMFYTYIHTRQAYHMLQRRPAVNAYNEVRDQGEDVPGVKDFTRTVAKVSLPKECP